MSSSDSPTNMHMYSDLAPWWPLLSSPADYAEEAEFFREVLASPSSGATPAKPTLLELGSGGGNLASHLKRHFAMTLSDLSPQMIEVSRALNPELEHVGGDMRTIRLGREFDAVLIHDAIMYCTDAESLRAALATAATHCRPGGIIVVAPDEVRETFEPNTDHGGEDGPDGRALRYLEWTYDPDPSDTTVEVMYTIVTRDVNGDVRVTLDRHAEGMFPRAEWLARFAEAGLAPRIIRDRWKRDVFVAVK